MPRPHRIQLAGIPQHIVQRGIDRQAVFFRDSDREIYLEALAESAAWYGLAVHAYCLMTNHVHLLVTPRVDDALSRAMRRLGSRYVAYINRQHGRSGTLWDGRFRACLVNSESHFLVCQRYIELNPVRAGLVRGPADYPWSSLECNGLGGAKRMLTPHAAYLQLGDSVEQRCMAYRNLFSEGLDDVLLNQVRDAVQHNHVLGNERFKRQIEKMLARKLGTGKPGRPLKA